jgi:hypothetical protein
MRDQLKGAVLLAVLLIFHSALNSEPVGIGTIILVTSMVLFGFFIKAVLIRINRQETNHG